jgi:hypothetical protein
VWCVVRRTGGPTCGVMDPDMVLACWPYQVNDGNLAKVFAARHVRYAARDCIFVYLWVGAYSC